MKFGKGVLGLGLGWFIAIVSADTIYQYTNSNGTIVYTNKPVKNSTRVKLPPLSVYAAPMTKNDFNARHYVAPPSLSVIKGKTPAATSSIPGFNEAGRRQILSEELTREKQALSDTTQALTLALHNKLPSEANNPAAYQNRLQALREDVTEHQKNIAILSEQLGIAN